MKLSGLYLAIVAAGSSIRLAGKKAEDRNRITKTSGNRPWTTDAFPVRSATAAPIPPKATAESDTKTIITSAPGTPSSIRVAEDQPDGDEPDRREGAEDRRPGEPPEHDRIARDRRRQQPVREPHLDVDRERDPAAVGRPAGVDWIIAPARMKSRKLLTGGNPGRSTPRPAPPVWTASRRVGKMMIGEKSWGRRIVCLTERAPSAPITRRLFTG